MDDISNQKFEKLIALFPVYKINNNNQIQNSRAAFWLTKCECGNEIIVSKSNLGKTKSCGCLKTNFITDLTGKKFGKLTVLEQDLIYPQEHKIKSQRAYWKCKCECGNIITICGGHLTEKDGIRECNKCRKNHKILDLKGQKINELTVIEKTNKISSNRNVIWKCQCSCGKIIEVNSKVLRNKEIKSCGCKKYIDISGQKFGKLTAIEKVNAPPKYVGLGAFWRCKCDCGAENIVLSHALRNGSVQSCGCTISRGEEKIANILSKNNILFEKQKTFSTCLAPITNFPLKFDFYVNNDFLLEFDGRQHYEKDNSTWNRNEKFEKRIMYDNIKNNWCKENKIPLKRIPYWELENITLENIMNNTFLII